MESASNDWVMELRRVEDRSGARFYIFTGDKDSGGFVSDIDGLRNNLVEFVRVDGEILETIVNMAVEGYFVRYYPQEKKVVAELSFT